jgi:AcrR family transcriptional regulator
MEKKQEKALKIGKAAVRLFNRKGYLETNMDHISAAARMSKGGVYHYFSSKDEILHFILSNYMDLILKDLESGLKNVEGAFEKIQFIISRHIELYTGNIDEAKTLLHEAHCLPARYYRTIAEKQRQYYRIVAKVISEFLGGRAKTGDAQVTSLTFLLFGMCNWIYSWYDPKGAISPEALSEMIGTIFLKGVHEYRE